MGLWVWIDPANRDVMISTHRNLKHIDPHGIEIHRLGRLMILATWNERREFPGDFLRLYHNTFWHFLTPAF
jgi:hypothetical protein